MRRSGGLPHLSRWFDLVSKDSLLASVAEQHGPRKPVSRVEYRKEVAAAGMGGGGAPLSWLLSSSPSSAMAGCSPACCVRSMREQPAAA